MQKKTLPKLKQRQTTIPPHHVKHNKIWSALVDCTLLIQKVVCSLKSIQYDHLPAKYFKIHHVAYVRCPLSNILPSNTIKYKPYFLAHSWNTSGWFAGGILRKWPMIGSAGGPGGRFLELRSFVDTTADASKRVVTTTENQKDGEFIMVKSEMPWCERCPQVCRQPCKPYTSRRLVNRYLLPHWVTPHRFWCNSWVIQAACL